MNFKQSEMTHPRTLVVRESAYSEAPSEMTIDEERHEEIGKKRNRKGHGSSSSEQTAAGSVENVRKKKKNKQTMKKMVRKEIYRSVSST